MVIPDEIDGKRVTSIGEWAFEGCSGLTEITLPESLTSIGDFAFYECSGLTEITLPEGVTSIGDDAFYGCSGLTEITIPEGVTSIGARAFFGTPWLKNKQSDNPMVIVNGILIDGTECKGSVVVPEGVTSIGGYAFSECSGLTEITLPEGVTSIGDDAFGGCSSSFRICGVEGSYAQKYASDNDINFEILSEPNVTEPVTTTSELLHETVSGDTNNDGIVSAADFIKLVQHILNPEMQINSKTSDLNGDGKIDSADAVELKKLFLG